jgi:VCBS repeat protein
VWKANDLSGKAMNRRRATILLAASLVAIAILVASPGHGLSAASEPTTATSPAPTLPLFYGAVTYIGDGSHLGQAYFLLRESNCSLTAQEVRFSLPHAVTALKTGYQDVLHKQAQLTTVPDKFPAGCKSVSPNGATGAGYALSGGRYAVALTNNPTNRQPGNLTVYIGKPGAVPSFTTATYPLKPAASFPLYPMVADLNGDGILDIVVPVQDFNNHGRIDVDVLIGNSNGTFKPAVDYPLAVTGAVTIDDVNNDGKPDIIAVGPNASGKSADPSVQALLNKGGGKFGSPINGPGGVTGYFVTTGLFRGGKIKDIATSDGFVLLGDGNGTFKLVAGKQFPFGTGVVAGDFNHDGKWDIAQSNIFTQSVSIFYSRGDGTFSAGPSYPTVFGAYDLGTSDLDGDGNLDLIAGDVTVQFFGPDINTFPFVHFLLGRHDGTFAGAPLYQVPGSAGASAMAVDTFEGGTREDILTSGSDNTGNNPFLYVLSNDGHGSFKPGPHSPIGFSKPLILSADMNHDGKPDAVMAVATGTNTGQIAVALGKGNGTFGAPIVTNVAIAPSQIAVGKFIGGNLDLAVTGALSSTQVGLLVLPGNGNGTFKKAQQVASIAGPTDSASMVVADLNRDGRPDIVLSNRGHEFGTPSVAGALMVFIGKGGGAFKPPITLHPGKFPGPVAVGDLNGDKIPDLVLSSADSSYFESVYALLGKGNGTFSIGAPVPLNTSGVTSAAVQDLNQDKKPDAVFSSCCGFANSYILVGNGNGTFQPPFLMPLPNSGVQIVAQDVSGDGKADLLQLNSPGGPGSQSIVVLRNVTGEVPAPIPVTVAAERLARWRDAKGVLGMAGLELESAFDYLADRAMGLVIANARRHSRPPPTRPGGRGPG